MDFRERHVVVTGGAGALGTALVGALTVTGRDVHATPQGITIGPWTG